MALTDSLVAFYPLDGDGADATGRGNDLTNSGASWVSGLIGSAADLERSESDYLTVADTADLSMGDIDFSVQAWVKGETLGAVSAWVLGKRSNAASSLEYQMEYLATDLGGSNRMAFAVSNGTTVNFVAASTFGALATGTWYHVVGVHDSVANTITIYVNGVADSVAHSAGSQNTGSPFQLGRLNTTAPSFFWDGLIDMPAVWKRALAAAEVLQLYNVGAGLVYPLTTATGAAVIIAQQQALLSGGVLVG